MNAHDCPMPKASNPQQACVPAQVAVPAAQHEPRKRVSVLLALLLFWLRPKYIGPHLAASSFCRAFIAHVLAACAILLMMLALWSWNRRGSYIYHAGQPVRVQITDIILEASVRSTDYLERLAGFKGLKHWFINGGWGSVLFTCIGIELAVILLGTLVMPYAADGDRAGSIWKRSVKNAYWCTTILVPLMLAHVALSLATDWWGSSRSFQKRVIPPEGWWNDPLTLAAGALAIASFILLLRALIVGAYRCVGEHTSRIPVTREPRCDQCGYLLRGLPIDSKCPECGLPVLDSLEVRNSASLWQQHESKCRGIIEAIRMQWVVLGGAAIFHRVPLHRGVAVARRFWWVTWLLIVLGLQMCLRVFVAYAPFDSVLRVEAMSLSIYLILLPFVLHCVMMFIACVYAHWRHGISDYRVSSIVCYYGSPLMWPLVMVLLVAGVLLNEPFLPSIDTHLGVFVLACGVLALGCGLFWWLRLQQAMQRVRFANA